MAIYKNPITGQTFDDSKKEEMDKLTAEANQGIQKKTGAVSPTPDAFSSYIKENYQVVTDKGAVPAGSEGMLTGQGAAGSLAPSGVVTSQPVKSDIAERGKAPGEVSFDDETDFEKWKERVTLTTEKPTTPDYVQQYKDLHKEYGTADIESEISSLEEEQLKIKQAVTKFKTSEAGGESLGFYTSRVSEAERYANERMTALQDREKVLTDRLSMKNATISTIMQLGEKSYADAKDDYEGEFDRNLRMVTAFQSEEDKADAHDKAAYQTMVNMFQNSGKGVDDLPIGFIQKANEYETRIGLPVGTFEALAQSKPGSNIIDKGTSYDASGNQFEWIIVGNADGSRSVMNIPTGGKKGVSGDSDVYVPNVPGLAKDQVRDFFSKTTPPDWFRTKMEEEMGMTILPGKLQEMWDEAVKSAKSLQSKAMGTSVSSSGGSPSFDDF